MESFKQITGVAAPLPMDNIDTDMIIPKQFLKTIKRSGLARGLFYELRFDQDGNKIPFLLDAPPYNEAKIIVAGENFGCGSSREHAPWAIADFGVRCIIAQSFADIFYNNCFKNGILPIALSAADVATLAADAEQAATLTVDLETKTITRPDGSTIAFDVDDFRRHCLLNGLDDIGLTLQQDAKIAAFEDRRRQDRPWL